MQKAASQMVKSDRMAQRQPYPVDTGTDHGDNAKFSILVVDDSRLQRRILCSTLKRLGYLVQEAECVQEAIARCAERMPDLVISDWIMPGQSGLDFCREFRRMTQDDYRYFILLTSKSEKTEVAEGLDAGADDFLIKPVDAHELRARITAGERIVRMQRELTEKNRLVQVTLEELQRVYNQLDKDLMDAKKLQQSLVPDRHRKLPTGELSLLLRSAGHVGGDLVGFFPTDDGKLGLYAIDVSGHGISSALMTARLAGNLSAAAPDQNVALSRQSDGSYHARPPAEVTAALNSLVLNEMETEHYFTLLLAFADLSSGTITVAQAGHPHPLILRADGAIEQEGTGGFPVGLIADVDYQQFELQLNAGDRLLLLSDGVTECPAADGDILGEEGLEQLVEELKNTESKSFLEALIWSLSGFAGTEEFPDDVSGVLFEYSGSGYPK